MPRLSSPIQDHCGSDLYAGRARFESGIEPRICVVNVLRGPATGCFRLCQNTHRIRLHDMKNPGCLVQPGSDCRLRDPGVVVALVDPERWPSTFLTYGLTGLTPCFSLWVDPGGWAMSIRNENWRICGRGSVNRGCLRKRPKSWFWPGWGFWEAQGKATGASRQCVHEIMGRGAPLGDGWQPA